MGLDGFDVTDPQGAIEFQGSCCNFYDGTPKRGGQFKDTSNPITDKIITAKEQMDACNELPEGSDADRSRSSILSLRQHSCIQIHPANLL